MTDFEPIAVEVVVDLENSMTVGLRREQAQHLLRELRRTEEERCRLQREVEELRASRKAFREGLMADMAMLRNRASEIRLAVKWLVDHADRAHEYDRPYAEHALDLLNKLLGR